MTTKLIIESAYLQEEGHHLTQAVLRAKCIDDTNNPEYVVHTRVTEIVDSMTKSYYIDGDYTTSFESALKYYHDRVLRLLGSNPDMKYVTESRMIQHFKKLEDVEHVRKIRR
jgi:hypothetical protein